MIVQPQFQLLFNFLVVAALSLILGLEQRRHHADQEEEHDTLLGTDRTFTFLGIFGFVLYILDPDHLLLFAGGGLVVSILMAIYYFNKIRNWKKSGLTSILSALITYCLAPILFTQPVWLTLTIVVLVLILIELKEAFMEVSTRFGKDEFISLAKFIVISGIILPNLPDESIQSWLPVSPYKLWLSLVISSGISYFSYLLKKFIFTRSGILISGLLGGLYSSTAVALILSKKSKDHPASANDYAASVLMATAVMYLRIGLVTWFLNESIARILLPYLVLFFITTIAIALVIRKGMKNPATTRENDTEPSRNPLELRVAVFFSFMYLVFSILSHFAESWYGAGGLHVLSFLAGFADVDSYIMSLVQGKHTVTAAFIATSIVMTSTANNIIKSIYSALFAETKTKRLILTGFLTLILINLMTLGYLNFFAFN